MCVQSTCSAPDVPDACLLQANIKMWMDQSQSNVGVRVHGDEDYGHNDILIWIVTLNDTRPDLCYECCNECIVI